ALAATAAGIGTAALSLSFPVSDAPGARRVGDRYFEEPMFRPAQPVVRDTWYLDVRTPTSTTGRIRDQWYRE
ncbi:MAG TPA: hypothetical protein VFM93_11745, partial [Candidatus Limnocylindria bacterium]|nr:hypothetical protein [Candidatus Limnocylindria bacterium]